MGVTIDNKLNFDIHIASTCLKANQKLMVFARLAKLLSFDKKQLLFKNIFWILFQIFSFDINGVQ